jgi:hypothetical protein
MQINGLADLTPTKFFLVGKYCQPSPEGEGVGVHDNRNYYWGEAK